MRGRRTQTDIFYLKSLHVSNQHHYKIQITATGNQPSTRRKEKELRGHTQIDSNEQPFLLIFHLHANDHKFKRKDGETANQPMKAIAAAVSKLVQWFSEHKLRSLLISTVMPADAQAEANVNVAVICMTSHIIICRR